MKECKRPRLASPRGPTASIPYSTIIHAAGLNWHTRTLVSPHTLTLPYRGPSPGAQTRRPSFIRLRTLGILTHGSVLSSPGPPLGIPASSSTAD